MSSHFESARRFKWLSRLTDEELRDFLRFTEFRGIRQFFELVKQGEHGDSMFMLLTGEVRVRLMFEEKERMRTLAPALLVKFLWTVIRGFTRRIRKDNQRYRDSLGFGGSWSPDDDDDDDC